MGQSRRWKKGERRPKCKTCVHCDRESWTCDVGRAGGVLMRPQNFRDIDIESPACRFYEKKGVRNGH